MQLALGIALAIHKLAKFRGVENQYLDSRAFAEALRVQFFWEMSGIEEPVDNFYLVHYRTQLDWIRLALRNVWLMRVAASSHLVAPRDVEAILYYWVLDQAEWYRCKAEKQARSVDLHRRISRIALWTAVAGAIVVPASLLVHAGCCSAIAKWQQVAAPRTLFYRTLHFVFTIPALLAGGYRLWIEQAGYEEQAREYLYMGKEFRRKARMVEQILDRSAPEADVSRESCMVLRDTGIEALKENARWLLLHREHPLQVDSP
jgi:hypothetical protein